MFDLRYHVASLAAVFFALVIGILVGVALASHGLGNSDRSRFQLQIANLRNDLEHANQAVASAEASGTANKDYVDKTYADLMQGRLARRRIAVLFVGPVDSDVRTAIVQTLKDGGARAPFRLRAIKVPVDSASFDKQLEPRPFLALFAGENQLQELGRALGREFVTGGDTPFWNTLQSQLVEERSGSSKTPANGVIVVRTAPVQTGATAAFLRGLYSGLAQSRSTVPAVGVESAKQTDSAVEVYKRAGLSSVDDLDTPVGRLALALLLADPAVTGNYGIKPTAQSPLPEIVPPAAVTTTTGG